MIKFKAGDVVYLNSNKKVKFTVIKSFFEHDKNKNLVEYEFYLNEKLNEMINHHLFLTEDEGIKNYTEKGLLLKKKIKKEYDDLSRELNHVLELKKDCVLVLLLNINEISRNLEEFTILQNALSLYEPTKPIVTKFKVGDIVYLNSNKKVKFTVLKSALEKILFQQYQLYDGYICGSYSKLYPNDAVFPEGFYDLDDFTYTEDDFSSDEYEKLTKRRDEVLLKHINEVNGKHKEFTISQNFLRLYEPIAIRFFKYMKLITITILPG